MPSDAYLRERTGDQSGCSLAVRVHPGAKQTAILGPYDDGQQLKIALLAPPAEGRANQALVKFLAEFFGLPQSAVIIAQGETSRSKLVRLLGLTKATALAKLG